VIVFTITAQLVDLITDGMAFAEVLDSVSVRLFTSLCLCAFYVRV
jgi:hypothetical protein